MAAPAMPRDPRAPGAGCALGGLTCGSPCSQGGEEGERRGAQHAGVAEDVEDPEGRVPSGAGGHRVRVRHDGDQHDRQGDGQPRQPLRHARAVVGLAHEHEVGHGGHGKHHDRDQLLRDPARQMPEPVEDPLPVLKVEEHRDPAGRQQDGRRNPRRHLRLLPDAEHRHQRLRPEQPRAPRNQRGEQNQRPLEFHYSSPFQSRLRRMNAKFGSLPTFGR